MFELRRGRTIDLLCGMADLLFPCKKGECVNSDYQDGASRADLLPSWHLEDNAQPMISKGTAATSPGRQQGK